MRGKFLALLFLLASCLLVPASSFAQQVAVTGTIADPAGIPYSFAQISFQIQPSGTNPCVLVNGTCQAIAGFQAASTNGSGAFSVNLYCNSTCSPSIQPSGTTWLITVTEPGVQLPWGTGPQSFTYVATITGAANLSTTLSGLAPALTQPINPGGGIKSFNCSNLPNIFNCNVVNPTGPNVQENFTPITSGPSLDCSQQPGAPDMGIQLNNCLAALPASGGVADATHFTSPQTISTAVVNSYPAIIVLCGVQVTQDANISLTNQGSSLVGCPKNIATLTKGANIDQITATGSYNVVSYLSMSGDRSGGFTGNGIVFSGTTFGSVHDNSVYSEASADFADSSSQNDSMGWNDLEDFGVNAINLNGSEFFLSTNDNVLGSNTETGPAILEANSNGVTFSHLVANVNGTHETVNTEGLHLNFVNSSRIQQNNGYSAIVTDSPYMTLAPGIVVVGGGAHGPTVNANSTALVATGGLYEGGAGGDIFDITNGFGIISGNDLSLNPVSGNAAVKLTGNLIGYTVTDNQVYFNTGESPTGLNYGVWMQVPASATFGQNVVSGNTADLTASTDDIGFFFDNTAARSGVGRNQFISNQCIGAAGGGCIKRTDSANNQDAYSQNATVTGGTLYVSGGSTGDVITQTLPGLTFANLPTAGDGSQIFCTDCFPTKNITAGSSTGAMIWHVNGAWTGNQVKQPITTAVTTAGTNTYTTPTGANYLTVTLCGGGGGGQGSGTSPGAAGTGGNSTFGSSFLTANGGVGGGGATPADSIGGGGGTASGGDINISGGAGGSALPFNTLTNGAPGAFSQAGAGGTAGNSATAAGGAAPANCAGGGGAGSSGTGIAGGGGGAGGYVQKFIASPAASYSYTVGAAGTAGSAGASGSAGGLGGAGLLVVTAYF